MRNYRFGLGVAIATAIALYCWFRKAGEEAPADNLNPVRGSDTFSLIPTKNDASTRGPASHPILTEDYNKRFRLATEVPDGGVPLDEGFNPFKNVPSAREERPMSLSLKNLTEIQDYLRDKKVPYHLARGERENAIVLGNPAEPFPSIHYVYATDGSFLELRVEIDRNRFEELLDNFIRDEGGRWQVVAFLETQKDRFQVVIHRGDIHMEDWDSWPANFKPLIELAIRNAVYPYLSGSQFE